LRVSGWDGFWFSFTILADVVARKMSLTDSVEADLLLSLGLGVKRKNQLNMRSVTTALVHVLPCCFDFSLFFLLDKKERKNQDCAIRPPLWHSGGGPVG
jgi:hypothetical protein